MIRRVILMLFAIQVGACAADVSANHDAQTPDAQAVVGDFDGDGRLDFGMHDAGHWWIPCSGGGGIHVEFGHVFPYRVLVRDYDGDGKDDVGFFVPTLHAYQYLPSSDPGTVVECIHGGCIPYREVGYAAQCRGYRRHSQSVIQ